MPDPRAKTPLRLVKSDSAERFVERRAVAAQPVTVEPAPPVTPPAEVAAAAERARARTRAAQRRHLYAALAHGWGVLLLSGWCVAGYVGWQVVVACAAWLGSGVAALTVTYRMGWNRRFKDPGLLVAQQSLPVIYLVALLFWAPQLAFFSVVALLVATADGFFAPNRAGLYVVWGPAAVLVTIAVFLNGSSMTVPAGDLLGKLCTAGLLLAALGRCTWSVIEFRQLQRRLRVANAELAVALGRIEDLARRDELTGLANRRAVMEWLGEQKAVADRTGRPFCIAIVDLDHFKLINDRLGHVGGDYVLKAFGRIAPKCLREVDRVGRYGGEEFMVVLPDTSLDNGLIPLERLCAGLRDNDWSRLDATLKVTATVGATSYRGGEPIEALVRRADEALYAGKAGGRNRVVAAPRPPGR